MGYLNTEGLKRFWARIKELKQDKLTPDDSIKISKEGSIGVSLPIKHLTLSEYQRLSEEEKNADIQYIVSDSPPEKDMNFHPHDYSEEETVIGTWIDGKPIYRKAIKFNLPANSSTDKYTISDFDIDTQICVNMHGVVYGAKSTKVIPNEAVRIYVSSTVPEIRMASVDLPESFLNQPAILFIEYTKTTDNLPNSKVTDSVQQADSSFKSIDPDKSNSMNSGYDSIKSEAHSIKSEAGSSFRFGSIKSEAKPGVLGGELS